MDFDLKGRVAFITGATSGLGRHFAHVLSKAGAAVAITGRRKDRLQAVREEIEKAGGRCAAVAMDVTDAAQIPRALDEAEAALGPIDILINNAGMSADGPTTEVKLEDFDAVMATNVRAPFLLSQEVGRRMITRKKGGRIINISSIAAFRVLPGATAYNVSKAGLSIMTQALAREWARYDINVNAICPGFIETELNEKWFATEKGQMHIKTFPRRRLQQATDLDGVLLLLASDASKAITGSFFNVDEAQSI